MSLLTPSHKQKPVVSGSIGVGFPLFLTAYDPSDLPGFSIDPLGFERGYLFLADKILPGLTIVADKPRYFSVLCAGALLAEVEISDPARLQYQRRLDCIQRFERFWALANVLASQEAREGDLPVSGIRGVTYAAENAESILRLGVRRVSADFKLLLRQIPYGVVGIYGAVADGMRLLDRKTLTLTPDLGERLAEGFLTETDTPSVLRKAVRGDRDIPLTTLVEWGHRAHISGETLPTERVCMDEALHRDPIRSRMAAVLAAHPFNGSQDSELQRLKRLLPALSHGSSSMDLREAVSAILSYEACYRLVMLAFERVLWLCKTLPSAATSSADLNFDSVLQLVCAQLPPTASQLGKILDATQSEQFHIDLHRLEDTRRFLECVAGSCRSPEALTREVLIRHSNVQQGKFDRGRRKMPWLETTSGRISLTTTRVGGLEKEATISDDIAPHSYRLSSADSLIAAAGAQ